MADKLDPLFGDRSDRNLDMMQRWQESIRNTQHNQQRPNEIKGDTDQEIRDKIRRGEIECPTCKERQYVDGSNDPGVSFKTPTKISPGQSKIAVLSHEREHVVRNNAEALAEGREVTHSSVSLTYAICPDCGRQYVSGGLTSTTTQPRHDKDKEKQDPFALIDMMI